MKHNSMTLKIDLRITCAVLLVIIAGMFALWRPWEGGETRQITIMGQTEIEATPDEFVFSPRFERTGDDVNRLKEELNTFGNELQTKLKELGVNEEDITLDSSSYDARYYPQPETTTSSTVTLAATIKVHNSELAQRVQDYLATTDAKGQLTASAQFSDAKRQGLEEEAREKAIADARRKANQTAEGLGVRVGKVIEVKDLNTGYGIQPGMRGDGAAQDSASLPVTPGKDTVTFRVEVVFELK